MVLLVIVGFVFVKTGVALWVGVLSGRIKPAVRRQRILWHPVPGLVGFFTTAEDVEAQDAFFAVSPTAEGIAAEVAAGPVDVAVARNAAQTAVERPATFKQAGAEGGILAPGVERTHAETEVGVGRVYQLVCLDVETGPKSCGAVGAGAYAALYLDVVDRAGKVGHIHPKHPVRLGIVHRNAVHGNVDAGGIAAPDANAGIANTRPGIAGYHHRRGELQQKGQVLSQVLFGQFLLAYIGHRHGRDVAGAGGFYHHLIGKHAFGLQGDVEAAIGTQINAQALRFVTQVLHPELVGARRQLRQAEAAIGTTGGTAEGVFEQDGCAGQRLAAVGIGNFTRNTVLIGLCTGYQLQEQEREEGDCTHLRNS